MTVRKKAMDVAWLGVLVAYVLLGTRLVPFHGDEAGQIFMSRDYAHLFINHDVERVRYHEPPTTLQLASLQSGSINKYLIGLAWHVAGYEPREITGEWNWYVDYRENDARGALPPYELLVTARKASAPLLAASVVVLFVLGLMIGGRPVAYPATLYYAVSPTVLINGRRAMMEGSMLFFGLLVVLAGILFAQRGSWRTAVLLGLTAGLALSAKQTNSLTVVAVFAAAAAYVLRFDDVRATARSWTKLGGATILALLVFYAMNPVWWGANPVEHARRVYEGRKQLLVNQAREHSAAYADRADQAAGFVRHALMGMPQYYEAAGWSEWIEEEVVEYEASIWDGVSIGGSTPGAAAVAAAVVVGVLVLMRAPCVPPHVRWIMLPWALAMIVSTWLLTPLTWARYYLPAFPAIALLGAAGLSASARWVARRTGVPRLHPSEPAMTGTTRAAVHGDASHTRL